MFEQQAICRVNYVKHLNKKWLRILFELLMYVMWPELMLIAVAISAVALDGTSKTVGAYFEIMKQINMKDWRDNCFEVHGAL